MPHSGPHFLRFWCDLVPKSSILGALWRPAGPNMAPKIVQMRQNQPNGAKYCPKPIRCKNFFGVKVAQLGAKGLPKSSF